MGSQLGLGWKNVGPWQMYFPGRCIYPTTQRGRNFSSFFSNNIGEIPYPAKKSSGAGKGPRITMHLPHKVMYWTVLYSQQHGNSTLIRKAKDGRENIGNIPASIGRLRETLWVNRWAQIWVSMKFHGCFLQVA